MRRSTIYLPLILGAVLSAGIWIGNRFSGNMTGNSGYSGYDKINAVIGIIEDRYVDSVDREKLVEETIAGLLQSLDPHSDYFTADEIREMNEPLQGNFEGIGIEYNLIHDTVTVMSVVPGGPSEKILLPGDRLVKADGVPIIGEVEEKFVRSKLRGPADTKVKVTFRRPGEEKLLEKEITRGRVPINSIDVAYMIDASTAYVKLTRFAEKSHADFVKALDSLKKIGMKKLVLDLRGNGGGYLQTAVAIADEFLPAGQKIVYTEGRKTKREDHNASSKGSYENLPLALLIDEGSASASEIIAGAIQDNDRGTIFGRRSFGKGLVQEEKLLSDSSGFRITISRYYTPSGRSIQKPYNKGNKAYYAEDNQRYSKGELLHADSIHFADSLKYKTIFKKRTVYGGGGIMPDIFVPLDTAGQTSLITKLLDKNAFNIYALDYATSNRKVLHAQGTSSFRREFAVSKAMLDAFVKLASAEGVVMNPVQLTRSEKLIRMYIKAAIARVAWDNDGFYPVLNDDDIAVKRAVESF
ncbi:MAG: carboxyl-terminal processing protease [Bacteroidetes bacterium]|nr:MAG: carboxyl-terminal processing protease [Bacteroidota bacterium]